MSEVYIPIALALMGLLIQAVWKISSVATSLEILCKRFESHETRINADFDTVHRRIDDLEHGHGVKK